ncbi:LPXTG cell wall anchor domain-containing protein [Limosilactobacillus fermentum]|uniref:LPXTG cell wall anchor domain-containing protein n=1 Tax=Limosilactobacillus fermentum TaxID=1613 RepID=UPI0021A5B4EB|nr:LPXTG cell wall anchor domain-containing protein [Limosilactobacillus fermentum]
MINTDDTKTTPTYRRPDSQPQSYVTFDLARPVLRHKMYKAGKSWMVAGVVGLATAGTMLMTSGQAHADTTTASTGSSTATSATGSTSTSSFTQVNVDSSGVTSAASAASHAGAKVTQTSGTTYNVQGSAQLNSATSAVASDYASETSALNSTAVEAQNSNANSSAVAAMNNQMSAVASSAQAAGVTVNQGSTVTVGSTGMTSAQAQAQIQSAQSSASATIASATATINSAKAVTSATNAADSEISTEIAAAQSAGVTVNSSTKAVSSVAEAEAMASSAKAVLDSAAKEATDSTKDSVVNAQYSNGAYTAYDSTNVLYRTANLGDGVGVTVNGPDEGGDNYGQYSVTVTGVDKAHIVTSVKVTSLEFPWGGNDGEVSAGSSLIPAYDYATAGAVRIYAVENGTWAFAPDAVHLADGSTTGLWIRFNGAGSAMDTSQKIAVYYTADGDIDSLVGGTKGYNDITNTMTYQIANKELTNMSEKYITAFWQNDIDMGQKASIGAGNGVNTQGSSTTSTSAVNLVLGGGMTNDTSKFVNDNSGNIYVKAADNLGYDPATGQPTGKNATVSSALNGVNSLPDGGVMSLIYGNHVNVSVQNSTSAGAWGVAQGMFGDTANVNIDTISADVTLPTYNPGTTAITVNKYVTGTPNTPTATYHLDTINYTTTGQKNVTDTQNGAATNIDGDYVTKGDTVQYTGTMADLPANRTSDITNVTFTDAVPAGVTVNSVKVYSAKGEDISNIYDITTTTDADGNHVVTAVGTDTGMLMAMNLDKTSSYKMPYIVITGTVNADNATLDNKIIIKINGSSVSTNTVKNKTPNLTPTKSETVDGNTEDGNGKTVLKGDTINYKISLDYSQLTTSTAISDDQKAKGLSTTDNYDSKTTADQSSLIVTDASGNTIPASYYKVTWDTTNHKLTLDWTNVDSFLKTYGGQKLTVKFNAKVNEDVKDGDEIKNTAYQNEFGHTYATDTVMNKFKVPDPKKDVVISVDNTKSLNGSTIQLNQEFDYALEGGEVPQGYAGKLTEYGFSDDYDQEHDQYNGQYTILADQDIHLVDGTVIAKGTSLNQYVTQSIDQENGEVTLEFNKRFLDQIDFSKGGFSATVYLGMKRIKAGTVYNVFTNTVNGKDYKSNTVKTTTPEPKTSETPATPTPQKLMPSNPTTPATPTPLVATPAPAAGTPTPAATPSQQTLPQTGAADEAGLVGLGLAGFLMSLGALGASKKRKQV